jgi:S1-C subfamily serine protease
LKAAAVLALLASGLARAAPAPPDVPPLRATTLEEAESAIVQLVTLRDDGARRVPRGSAFYVSDRGDLLTCAHVIDRLPHEEPARLRHKDGTETPFRVIQVDREVDLALLRAAPAAHYLALGDPAVPELGRRVVFGGFLGRADERTGGPTLRFKHGSVESLEKRKVSGARRSVSSRRSIVTLKVDQIADLGQSGGPLLAEDTLEVVGVMRANLETTTGGLAGAPPSGHGAAVPTLYVAPFLREAVE